MRDKISVVLRAFFESVKYSVEAFSLPTGKHLLPSLLFGIIILITSVICKVFDLPYFLSWEGALLGVIILVVILIIERRERNEVSAFYRVASNSVQSVVQRAKKLGTRGAAENSAPADVTGDIGREADEGNQSETSD